MSFGARITVVLKEEPWKLMTEDVSTLVELTGENERCKRVISGC